MSVWAPNEIAMVESALRAGITPTACKAWFPNRSRQAIRSCFERVRIRLGIRGTRGRPPCVERVESDAININYADRLFESNAREGSQKLLRQQLQTGQYFGRARQEWLERHDRFAA